MTTFCVYAEIVNTDVNSDIHRSEKHQSLSNQPEANGSTMVYGNLMV